MAIQLIIISSGVSDRSSIQQIQAICFVNTNKKQQDESSTNTRPTSPTPAFPLT